jgi:serine/threonine-protein kinase
MGEVYQATDTNLKRQVAIKVLPASVAGDADRLARFQREAEVLAALNHPNIGAIYGLEKTPDFTALVMELVEAEDLSQRIARGPLPLDEALPIAKQIADALEAAHEQGIIHRDLKPANIKVRSDGTAKVLDFGLAKAMESPAGSSPPASMSPTLTTPAMTQAGVILGTAAYMSAEQAKGRPVDRRVDVWAFGCVLFEMLTGRRAFEGDDVADTLANVLKSQPDWSALPPNVPPAIRVVIKRCLEKDRTRRVADVATVAFVLDEAASLTATDGSSARVAESPSREAGRRRLVALGLAALLAAIAAVFIVWSLALPTAAPQVVRLTMPLSGDSVGGAPTGQPMIAISPEGTRFVYVARGRLFLREVSQFDARVVPVTNAGPGVHTPVFSPDGQSLAFFSADRTIKRVAVDGGAAVTVCGVDEVFGMTWHGSEIIVGRGRVGIARCPAAGGAVEQIAVVEDGEEAHGPQMLPGGDALLFTIGALGVGRQQWDSARWDRARIVVQSRSSGARKTLIEGGSDARYVPTGHILYAIGGVVFAVPFTAPRQEVTGPAIPVVEGVRRTVAGTTGAAQFAVSHTGNLCTCQGPSRRRRLRSQSL